MSNESTSNSNTHPLTLSPAHPLTRPQPQPRTPINIRIARHDKADLKFIDDLQKKHSKGLGYWPRAQLEGYVKAGDVWIAESPPACLKDGTAIPGIRGIPLGYIIARDSYFKREDVGVIYQVAVSPGNQRKLVGAALVKHVFEQASYGCKLFCCWCGQDLPANEFWESLGFVPLAFRTGSEKKERIHIFWQKRIRAEENRGNADAPGGSSAPPTPYWFPSRTSGGAIREDRLVIPIPPGTHWRDAKPMLLPEIPGVNRFIETTEPHALTDGEDDSSSKKKKKRKTRPRKFKMTEEQERISNNGGLWFAPPAPEKGEGKTEADDERKRTPRIRRKYHPEYIAAARELCARYLEEVQRNPNLLEGLASGGKYDVSRQLSGRAQGSGNDLRLLDAA